MRFELNPEGIRNDYLEALNACFGHWGDQTFYDWAFERSNGGPVPDLMVLRNEGGDLISGSAVSYRQLHLATDELVTVGIMTGSWTLPAARGRGCFTKMIHESVRVSGVRGCAALLAFVTEDNPSRSALERAGSLMIPSEYISSSPTGAPSAPRSAIRQLDREEVDLDRLASLTEENRAGTTHIHYPDTRAWATQFFERPLPTAVLESSDGWWAVIEYASHTDRLQTLIYEDQPSPELEAAAIEDLIRFSALQQRRMFAFRSGISLPSLGPDVSIKQGYVTALPSQPGDTWHTSDSDPLDSAIVFQPVRMDSGDRM